MPLDLADLYDRDFFREYGRQNSRYVCACELIATEIHRRFRPTTVVDWGCGAGLHAAALARLGTRVVGVDGVRVPDEFRAADVDPIIADLALPVDDIRLPGRYDLSLCIDVLEHLPDDSAEHALANVCRGADLVILSCAPPGQGGHHHVNEQPRRYWVDRMANMGWHYDRRETGAMERVFLGQRDRLPWSWMYHNLCIYRPAPSR